MFNLNYTNDYEVLTPTGFKSFNGVSKSKQKTKLLKIILDTDYYIKCSYDHIFVINNIEITAKQLKVNDYLNTINGLKQIIKIESINNDYVYELFDVKDGIYYTNDIVSHNCRFLGSNNLLIEPDTLEKLYSNEPLELKWNGVFQIYEQPIKNKLYILGIDVGKGTGRDYSIIQVLKFNSEYDIEQVAIYRNNMIDTHAFSEICISISEFYYGAEMMVENNDVGSAVCDTIWHEYEYDKILNCDKVGLGIRSTKINKIKACMLLKRYIESGFLKIRDRNTLEELSHYVEVRPNIFNAENNGHDDTITSLYWALYYITTPFYEGKDDSIKYIDSNYKLEDEEKFDSDNIPAMVFDTGVDNYQEDSVWH